MIHLVERQESKKCHGRKKTGNFLLRYSMVNVSCILVIPRRARIMFHEHNALGNSYQSTLACMLYNISENSSRCIHVFGNGYFFFIFFFSFQHWKTDFEILDQFIAFP